MQYSIIIELMVPVCHFNHCSTSKFNKLKSKSNLVGRHKIKQRNRVLKATRGPKGNHRNLTGEIKKGKNCCGKHELMSIRFIDEATHRPQITKCTDRLRQTGYGFYIQMGRFALELR